MKLTPKRSLIAGAALILLANGVALTGVYFNRSGEPEARITLSQRELSMPWDWVRTRENSGMVLGLSWRVNDAEAGDYYDGGFGYSGGTPDWLDATRMQALGFAVAPVAQDIEGRRRFERQLQREALLVLELDGPARQQALERARAGAARHEAAHLANADSKEFADKAKRARERVKNEEDIHSRLFAIDAGLDRTALRAKYPDRSRYLILKAMVRPSIETREGKTRVTGYVSQLAVQRINVPHALRPALEPALRQPQRMPNVPNLRFEATLAVGQRLEPWIEAVTAPRASP